MKMHHPAHWNDLRSQTVDPGDVCLIFCPEPTSSPDACVEIVLPHRIVHEIDAEVSFWQYEQDEMDAAERSES